MTTFIFFRHCFMAEKLIVVVLSVCVLMVVVYLIPGVHSRVKFQPTNEGITANELINLPNIWARDLDVSTQLQLAIELVKLLMPEWEKYLEQNLTDDNFNTSSSNLAKADQIINVAFREINNSYNQDLQEITNRYMVRNSLNAFINLSASISDGEWVIPWTIQKMICALFNILEGIEQTNDKKRLNYFLKSICISITCIEAHHTSKTARLNSLLEPYKSYANHNIITI